MDEEGPVISHNVTPGREDCVPLYRSLLSRRLQYGTGGDEYVDISTLLDLRRVDLRDYVCQTRIKSSKRTKDFLTLDVWKDGRRS